MVSPPSPFSPVMDSAYVGKCSEHVMSERNLYISAAGEAATGFLHEHCTKQYAPAPYKLLKHSGSTIMSTDPSPSFPFAALRTRLRARSRLVSFDGVHPPSCTSARRKDRPCTEAGCLGGDVAADILRSVAGRRKLENMHKESDSRSSSVSEQAKQFIA